MSELNLDIIPDESFARGAVPMTKAEVRLIALWKLSPAGALRLADIGAGTGAVTVDCSRAAPGGTVYAVERNTEALSLLTENVRRFAPGNVHIVAGEAPAALEGLGPVDRAFVGGSGGRLSDILQWLHENLAPGGRVVVTAITLDTLAGARAFFRERGYGLDIIQLSVARSDEESGPGMLRAANPVFIITAWRNPS